VSNDVIDLARLVCLFRRHISLYYEHVHDDEHKLQTLECTYIAYNMNLDEKGNNLPLHNMVQVI
jgi:hypothetical protein